MSQRWARSAGAGLAAVVLAIAVPAVALAHPLGNFTINHYAGISVSPDVVALDVVVDMAEIPTFQERQRIDVNGDGAVSDDEVAVERRAACARLDPSLGLVIDGRVQPLTVTSSALRFPPGSGSLPTMRLECGYEVRLAATLAAGTTIAFSDTSYAERIGWREIVVTGDGVAISGSSLATTSVSNRLAHYPADLLSQPLDVRSVSFGASPTGVGTPASVSGSPAGSTVAADGSALVGAVPGGVGENLAALIGTKDLTLPVVLLSLFVAMGLGAVHAVSPGHGKTVMAAYLVGSRGTARHAVALGLTVTVSHTLGVLGLAAITIFAARLIPPERLYPILGLASGSTVIAIGGWLLVARYRAWAAGGAHEHAHRSDRDVEHDHAHDGHTAEPVTGEHTHGGLRQRHVPEGGATFSWRSLFALGLSGGLVPSASALILLLGSIALGRLEYGVLLVVAFGLGMALVLGGVGLALVHAGRLLERVSTSARVVRFSGALPVLTAVVVVIAGVLLTGQALTQVL